MNPTDKVRSAIDNKGASNIKIRVVEDPIFTVDAKTAANALVGSVPPIGYDENLRAVLDADKHHRSPLRITTL